MGSLIKKAGVKGMAAGAVSLVLVAGGFHVLWEDYQRGNLFKPELFVKNRKYENQALDLTNFNTANVEGWQWRPDLIWFDNLSSVEKAMAKEGMTWTQVRNPEGFVSRT